MPTVALCGGVLWNRVNFSKIGEFLKNLENPKSREGRNKKSIKSTLLEPLRDHYGPLPKKLWGVCGPRYYFFRAISQKYLILRNFSKSITSRYHSCKLREVSATARSVYVIGWVWVMRYAAQFWPTVAHVRALRAFLQDKNFSKISYFWEIWAWQRIQDFGKQKKFPSMWPVWALYPKLLASGMVAITFKPWVLFLGNYRLWQP